MKRPDDTNDLRNYSRLSEDEYSPEAVGKPISLWIRFFYFRSLQTAERFIRRKRDSEYLAAFDPATGKLKQAWYVRGRRMIIRRDQQRVIAGCILTHHHPDGWEKEGEKYVHGGESFSDADISLACRSGVAELRVVSRKYLYIMKPPPAGWGMAFWDNVLEPLIPRVEAELLQAEWGELVTGKAYGYYHALWTRVAERTGIYYERRRIY